ncbi:hypothetical protein [Terribacillus saccharophilus]|uniref:hypothetical protein n=1 Tax=Terribacillus saccharophilus TaxID=361277 RepID=UPI000C9A5A45|nr:hypothetical protein [Terribacillus goriensis]
MDNKVGRKNKLEEATVNSIVLKYKENVQPHGKIKYKDIYNYTRELFHQGELDELASDTFWRKKGRLGRTVIDKINELIEPEFVRQKEHNVLPNLMDILGEAFITTNETTKKQIIAYHYLSTKNLNDKIQLEELNIRLRNEISELKQDNKQLQDRLNEAYYDINFHLPSIEKKSSKDIFSDPFSFTGEMQEKKINANNKISTLFKNNLD